MDYAKLLKIDRNALDDALVRQPSLFLSVSQGYVEAVSERDEAKEDIAVTKAEVSLDVRTKLDAEGSKSTEAIVTAMVEIDKRYRTVMKIYLEAKKEADRLLAMKEAFQQRAYVLKDLATLYVAGYYGDSVVRGSAPQEVRNQAYQTNREKLAKRYKGRSNG